MKYKGSNLNSRDIATIELLDKIRDYFDEDGAALNALALGGVRAEDYATTSYINDSIKDLITEQYADGKYATIKALDNFLPSGGGTIDWLDVDGLLWAAEALFDSLNTDALDVNGDIWLCDGSLFIYDNDVKLENESSISVGGTTYAWLKIDGGDRKVQIAGSSIEIMNNVLMSDGRFIDFGQQKTVWGDEGYLHLTSDADIALSAEGIIELECGGSSIASFANDGFYCSTYRSISFSFGADDGSEFMYIEQGEITLHTDVVTITGDLVVHGSIASGGKEQEGDSALADLEERVAKLESLIS